MKKTIFYFSALVFITALTFCNNPGTQTNTVAQVSENTGSVPFKAVPMPDPGIPGYNFPEPEVTINGWIQKNDTANMYLHSWGIWTSLTMNSGEKYNGEDLRVFETWFTPDDITAAIEKKNASAGQQPEAVSVRGRGKLKRPNQALHAIASLRKLMKGIPVEDSSRILGFVKYDPSAAQFTIDNTLYDSTTLQTMLNQGKTDIPDFPNTSVTTKPVFNIITQNDLKENGGYYRLKVWSGPPAQPIAYPDNLWPGCVYVDVNNQGVGNGSIDMRCKGRTPQNTYNVNDFINFKLTQEDAAAVQRNLGISASEGDIAILVAMHVTSREIKRWTWQSYWWAPDADNPPLPSSGAIANSRPQQLQGAPRHYAMTVAYTFIEPDQPYAGGNNVGTSIYAFNPYLEAGFGTSTFYEIAKVQTNGKTVVNNVGVRTNCMSCHALANFNPGNAVPTGPGYIGNTYIDMEGARFKGVLKLDFLWSIQGNIIEDSTATASKK